jgi:hypothetical protein
MEGIARMWQLEGYQYDLTAELLTARLVRVGQAGRMTEAERSEVEIPICHGLRRLIDETLSMLYKAVTPAER